mmetsp:Transcript_7467/g.9951  ORF Transcript_7467/g.9951 Transcript_7467/m.9951 type:complete len:105 (+) Transcript_7467:211-525(+)
MNSAVSQVPEHQKVEFMKHLEQMQVKDSLRMYNNLVGKCFDECVQPTGGGWLSGPKGFKSKKLTDTEDTCVEQCAEKFIKLTQRVGFRFAEHQQQQAAGAPPQG